VLAIYRPSSPDVVVGYYQTVTLDGTEYGTVFVKQGGKAIFSNVNVFLKKLKMQNSAEVDFSGCTNLYIQDKVKFKRNASFNNSKKNVFVYVDGRVDIERGSNINGSIHANNSLLRAKGKIWNPTQMNGLFIGNKVKGEKFVSWNMNPNLISCDSSVDLVTKVADEKETIKGELKILANESLPQLEFSVKTWPVPSNNEFYVKVNGTQETEIVSINVYDINGRLVHEDSFSAQNQYIFGNNLLSGIYIVKIVNALNIKTIRIIKN